MGHGKSLPVLLAVLFIASQVDCARITSLIIPKWIQNGTEDQVILDCDYDFDAQLDQNLTIKWYFNEKTELIYEWIPRLDFRYVSGKLQGKFNWDFSILSLSKDAAYKKYRALAIKTPTTELTGRYICQVVSALGDDSEEESMIVYAPPEVIEFTVVPLRNENNIQLEYKVKRVYPMPRIQIYQTCQSSDRRQFLSASDVEQEQQEDKINEQIASNSDNGHSYAYQRNTQNDKTIDDDDDESGEDAQHMQQQQQDDHAEYVRQKSISDVKNIANGHDNLLRAPGLSVSTRSSKEQVDESTSHQDDTDSSINNNDLTDETSSLLTNNAIRTSKEVNNINKMTHRTDKRKESLHDKTNHKHEPATSSESKVNTLNTIRSHLMNDYDDSPMINYDWQSGEKSSQETVNNEIQDATRKENKLITDTIDRRNTWFTRPSVHHHQHQHHQRHAWSHVDSVDLHRKSQTSRETVFSRHSEQLRKRRKSIRGTDTLKDEKKDDKKMQLATKYIGETKWKGKNRVKQPRTGGDSEGGDLNEWKSKRDKRTLSVSVSSSSSHSGQENEEMQSSGTVDALNDAHQVHLSPSCDTPFSSHALCNMKKDTKNRVTRKRKDESEDDTDTHTDEDKQMKQEAEEEDEDEESQVFSSTNISDDDVNTVSSVAPPSPWMNGQSTSSNSDGTLTLQYVHFLHSHQVILNHRTLCASFNEPVIFQLQASIPGTDFVVKKSVEYILPTREDQVHSTNTKDRHHQFTR